jgi:hypothetical protein
VFVVRNGYEARYVLRREAQSHCLVAVLVAGPATGSEVLCGSYSLLSLLVLASWGESSFLHPSMSKKDSVASSQRFVPSWFFLVSFTVPLGLAASRLDLTFCSHSVFFTCSSVLAF